MTGRVRGDKATKMPWRYHRIIKSFSGLVWLLAVGIGLTPIPSRADPGPAFPRGDGQVRIFNYHLNEFAEIRFRDGDKLLPEGLEKADALLRSRDNSEQTKIDPRLLDLIDFLQDHFAADTVEIISGYRRKEFNEALLKEGHSVSPVSLHTHGQALDIHLDEIREETLRDYLLGLRLGGVGYYGPLDFVHVDVGPVRRWSEGEGAARKLVGVLQPGAPIQLRSDKNDYLPNETLYFTWESAPDYSLSQIQTLKLEHFFRGRWTPCPQSAEVKPHFGLPAAMLRCNADKTETSYGKFRWTFQIPGNPEPLSSNEFYLKKQ